jgi:hypothetical protein
MLKNSVILVKNDTMCEISVENVTKTGIFRPVITAFNPGIESRRKIPAFALTLCTYIYLTFNLLSREIMSLSII